MLATPEQRNATTRTISEVVDFLRAEVGAAQIENGTCLLATHKEQSIKVSGIWEICEYSITSKQFTNVPNYASILNCSLIIFYSRLRQL